MEKTVLQKNLERLLAERDESALAASRGAGLPADAIRDILRGRSLSPRGKTLQKLATYFGLSVEQLTRGGNGGGADGAYSPPLDGLDVDTLERVIASTRESLLAMRVTLPPRVEAHLIRLCYVHIMRNRPDDAAYDVWLRQMVNNLR